MSTHPIPVEGGKLYLASLLEALYHWRMIRARIADLQARWPNIETDWYQFESVIGQILAHEDALTASLSKDEKIPDWTSPAPSVFIGGLGASIYSLLAALSRSGMTTVDIEELIPIVDDSGGVRSVDASVAQDYWEHYGRAYLEIINHLRVYGVMRHFGGEVMAGGTYSKTPGQLAEFARCPIPLVTGGGHGPVCMSNIRAALGSYYHGWLHYTPLELMSTDPPSLIWTIEEVSAEKDTGENGVGYRVEFQGEGVLAVVLLVFAGGEYATATVLSQPDEQTVDLEVVSSPDAIDCKLLILTVGEV